MNMTSQQELPILTNVAMAVAAAQSTGALLLVVLEPHLDHRVSTLVHGIATTVNHHLPPLTLRLVAQSHEHNLFSQVYGQPTSVPMVYLLRSGRLLESIPATDAALDQQTLKVKILQALGLSSSTVASPSTTSSTPKPTTSNTPKPTTSNTPKSTPKSHPQTQPQTQPQPTPAPTTTTPTPAKMTTPTDTDTLHLAIRHLDGSVSRHAFSLTSTSLSDLAAQLCSPPHQHPRTHGLMQSYPTRLVLYTSAADAPQTPLGHTGLVGPSATLVVRPPVPNAGAATTTRGATRSVKESLCALVLLVVGWVQAVLMYAVQAWLRVGGHRPARSDPGMAEATTTTTTTGAFAPHGVPDPEVVRKRRLQTLADLARREGQDGEQGPRETYNGNSTSQQD